MHTKPYFKFQGKRTSQSKVMASVRCIILGGSKKSAIKQYQFTIKRYSYAISKHQYAIEHYQYAPG